MWISEYARRSQRLREDFADSVKLYCVLHAAVFKMRYPYRYEFLTKKCGIYSVGFGDALIQLIILHYARFGIDAFITRIAIKIEKISNGVFRSWVCTAFESLKENLLFRHVD